MTKKISIVMAYWDERKAQTIRTLDNFENIYKGKYDFEVIIVDDASSKENKLNNLLKKYTFPINYIEITKEEKGERMNPCIAYNRGFKEATGNRIIIQNPECYHVGDLLKIVNKNLTKENYITFSCFSGNSEEFTLKLIENPELIKEQKYLKKNRKEGGQKKNWYNHPVHMNSNYHFCSAIYKCNLDKMKGFDEAFAEGYSFDDDEFILRIEHELKLNVMCLPPDNGYVIHQWHPRQTNSLKNESDTNPIRLKWLKNKKIFEEKKKKYGLL